MTLQRIHSPYGLPYPSALLNHRVTATATSGGFSVLPTAGTMDAAAEKVAMMGHVYWHGAPAAAKTMNSTSKIHFRTGTVTFANAGTTLRVGLQDVATGTGPPIQPDGTFDVYVDLVGGGVGLTSADDNDPVSVSLSTSGSKSVTHGDLIAVVFEMTARAGVDSVVLLGGPNGNGLLGYSQMPLCSNYTTSWPNVAASAPAPMVMLEASDGTLGVLMGGGYYGPGSAYVYQASSTPDERGLIFQVPFRCTVNSIYLSTGGNAAAADGALKLYSDPLGTPVEMASITLLGERGGNVVDERMTQYMLASEQTLEPNTNYCISYLASGTADVNLGYINLSDAAHRAINGLDNCSSASRSNATGAFGSLDTVNIVAMAVGICALDDGAGSGGGMLRHPGMSGGLNG